MSKGLSTNARKHIRKWLMSLHKPFYSLRPRHLDLGLVVIMRWQKSKNNKKEDKEWNRLCRFRIWYPTDQLQVGSTKD